MFKYVSTPFKVTPTKTCESFTSLVYSVSDDFPIPSGMDVQSKKRKKINHASFPCSFDIETTKYTNLDGEERRAMFVWQFDMNLQTQIMGRTWQEFADLLDKLNEDENQRIFHIFVHNLTYETYHMIQPLVNLCGGDWRIKLLDSMKVWAIEWKNIVFHDSAVIFNMSLAKTAEDFNKKYFKAVGDFDYEKKFNILDNLSHEEIGYCLLDVLSLTEAVKTEMQAHPTYALFELPKTSTGFVRKDLLKLTRINRRYRDFFKKLALTVPQYELCREAFEGGFTAGSFDYYGQIIKGDIRCRDITSSYPYQTLAHYYPISKFTDYKITDFADYDDFIECLLTQCVIATYTFTNVKLKEGVNSPRFSVAKCKAIGEYDAFNGKLFEASYMTRTMTEVAFFDFIEYYDYDEMYVENIMVARRGELPEPIQQGTRNYFDAKSQLKGVEGKELEYMVGKGNLNSIYGCMASRLDREEWNLNISEMNCSKTPCNLQECLDKYYDSENSFVHYQWACYVTSWARHQVFEMMNICGTNWLYTDTDSVYYISTPEIEQAFEDYNKTIPQPYSTTTSKGKITVMGEVTPDGSYSEFRQWGAKKYCKRSDHGLQITVAGVPKCGVKVLNDDINNFIPGLIFRGIDTGKLRPQYNFAECATIDVNGVPTYTASSINLLPCDYELSGVDGTGLDIIDNMCNNLTRNFETV